MLTESRNRRTQQPAGAVAASSSSAPSSPLRPAPLQQQQQQHHSRPSMAASSAVIRRRSSRLWHLLLVFGLGSFSLYTMDRYFGRVLSENVSVYGSSNTWSEYFPMTTTSASEGNKQRARINQDPNKTKRRKEQQKELPHSSQQQHQSSSMAHQGGGRRSNKAHWTSGATKLPNGQDRPIYIQDAQLPERCAICFWGLPRAFSALVLPALIQNVLIPNAKHHCDFFVHYHHLEQEAPSRSGRGGLLNPLEVLELAEAAATVGRDISLTGNATYEPVVQFTKTTEEDFFQRRGVFINRTRTAKDIRGRYKFFPWKEKSFSYPQTTDNIIRMWDGLSAVSKLVKDYETKHNIQYTRLAMLRSDVAFVTPIDIYSVRGDATSSAMIQRTAVVPGFAKWPVNDRMMYGPAPAVRIWAAERFRRIEQHVRRIAKTHPGHGMQDEYYLDETIFPAIHELGIDIEEDETMCFLRTRVDESVWVNDCGDVNENKKTIERLIKRPCHLSRLDENLKKGVVQLECREGIMGEAVA